MADATAYSRATVLPQNQPLTTTSKKRLLPRGSSTLFTHVLAVGFAVAVTVLSARGTYFKDISAPRINTDLQAFQFVAKVHDIIVAYSLSEIAIYHLTYSLCLTDGVPLGLLTAAFNLATPLSLFQKEYLRSLPSVRRRKWSRQDWRAFHFGTLVLVGTIITAVIAPLSAILFVPELNWWHVDNPFSHPGDGKNGVNTGFTYWNTSYENLWPTIVTNQTINCTDQSEQACPWYARGTLAGWGRDVVQQHVTGNVLISEQGNMAKYIAAGNNGNLDKGFVAVSTPMSGLTRNMGTLWLWASRLDLVLSRIGQPVLRLRTKNKRSDQQIMRPLVQAQCNPAIEITGKTSIRVAFPTDQLKVGAREVKPSNSLNMKADTAGYSSSFQYNNGSLSPSIDFFDLETDAGRPMIGFLFAASFGGPKQSLLPNTTGEKFGNYSANIGLFVCSMISHWVPAELSLAPRSINLVTVENNVDPGFWTAGDNLPDGTRPINLTLDYMNVLNRPESANSFQSWMQYVLGSLAPDFPFYEGTWWPLHTHVATMISLLTADSLSRIGHEVPMFVWYIGNDTSRYYSNNLGDLNNANEYAVAEAQNQIIMNHADEVRSHPENYTEVEWLIQRHGYGWSFGEKWTWGPNVLKRVAILVIMIHVLIMFLHWSILIIAFIGGRRWDYDALDSPLTLVLLALQTPERYVSRSQGATNAGSGIRPTSSAYRDVVRIEIGDGKDDPMFEEESFEVRRSVLTVKAPHEVPARMEPIRRHRVGEGLLRKRVNSHIDEVELAEYDPSSRPNRSRL